MSHPCKNGHAGFTRRWVVFVMQGQINVKWKSSLYDPSIGGSSPSIPWSVLGDHMIPWMGNNQSRGDFPLSAPPEIYDLSPHEEKAWYWGVHLNSYWSGMFTVNPETLLGHKTCANIPSPASVPQAPLCRRGASHSIPWVEGFASIVKTSYLRVNMEASSRIPRYWGAGSVMARPFFLCMVFYLVIMDVWCGLTRRFF